MRRVVSVRELINWVLVIMFCIMLFMQITKVETNSVLVVGICLISVLLDFNHMKKRDTYALAQIGLFFVYGIVTVLKSNGGIGGIYSILAGLIVFLCFKNSKLNRGQLVGMMLVMLYVCIYWIIKSPTWYDIFFQNQWLGDGTVANSNGIGKVICYTGILLFIILGELDLKIVKFIRIILVIACVWGIYNVKARMSLVVFVLFFLLCFIYNRIKKNKSRFLKITFSGAILTEIIFPIIYLWMYRQSIGINLKSFGLAEKGLYSGRQIIWMNALKGMDTWLDWMIGVGSKNDYWEGNVLNMHNNAMNLLVVVGILGLIWFLIFLYREIFGEYDINRASLWQTYMLIFFICVLVEGVSDITIFYNEFLLYIYMPLGIACNRNYSKNIFDKCSSIKNGTIWREESKK